jgi:hypothetical protein
MAKSKDVVLEELAPEVAAGGEGGDGGVGAPVAAAAPGEGDEGGAESVEEVTADTVATVENYRKVVRARARRLGVAYVEMLGVVLAETPGLEEAIRATGREAW